MRRKDREMDEEFALYVIDKAEFCTLSAIYENKPYSIPLSPARVDKTIYFHGAMEGTKKEIFDQSPEVRLVFVTDVQVPEVYSDEEIREIENPGLIISKVFTTEFASTIATGKIEECLNDEEKVKGLRAVCERFTPSKMEFFDMAIKASLDRTAVWKFEIQELTAKRKKLTSK